MAQIQSFKDLIVWQRSMDLIEVLYEVTRRYPPDERFGLIAETRKTARSIAFNIAEGKSRCSIGEYHQGISVAIGSAGELLTQVLVAQRVKYLDGGTASDLEGRIAEIARMLRGLEMSLRR
jgi:four helix bundle protein